MKIKTISGYIHTRKALKKYFKTCIEEKIGKKSPVVHYNENYSYVLHCVCIKHLHLLNLTQRSVVKLFCYLRRGLRYLAYGYRLKCV